MSAKSAISKEIFAPLDERMLGAVQVKRRTKKKIPFLATGGQGEYLTYICLSVFLKSKCLAVRLQQSRELRRTTEH
uniref:Syntaxin binding protein 6 n=1 Tax=Equus caballus TaxID=9796 RepID=A0A9L0RCL9_HORSE